MNQETYTKTKNYLIHEALKIENAKRPGYTIGDADVLRNFKAVAQRSGISTRQCWATYFSKHVDALMAWAKDPNIPQAEKLDGRFMDALNYIGLGYAIYREEQLAKHLQEKRTSPNPLARWLEGVGTWILGLSAKF